MVGIKLAVGSQTAIAKYWWIGTGSPYVYTHLKFQVGCGKHTTKPFSMVWSIACSQLSTIYNQSSLKHIPCALSMTLPLYSCTMLLIIRPYYSDQLMTWCPLPRLSSSIIIEAERTVFHHFQLFDSTCLSRPDSFRSCWQATLYPLCIHALGNDDYPKSWPVKSGGVWHECELSRCAVNQIS